MNQLEKLFRKQTKFVIGLMSGTSADGIDAVVANIQGNGKATRIQQVEFQTYPYPKGFKEFLLKNSNPLSAKLDDVTRLNILVGELFADAARKIIRKIGKKNSNIDLIGSHGQTIQHLPEEKKIFGKRIHATLQVGDPSVIAKKTGIVTVGDFRVADVAVGGTGAPLVPYCDYLLFRSKTRSRCLLNIGGIANITVLPKFCELDDVFAFDTGPGNMVIDTLMIRLYGRAYDEYGLHAKRGNISSEVLCWMIANRYFRIKPPKSCGRETFGEKFVENLLYKFLRLPKKDLITSATEFTALSIYKSYLRFIKPRVEINEIIVSGGGVHNEYLMDALQRYFGSIKINIIDYYGYSADAKEALCFALLANETIAGVSNNVRGATGARCSTVLGKICLP